MTVYVPGGTKPDGKASREDQPKKGYGFLYVQPAPLFPTANGLLRVQDSARVWLRVEATNPEAEALRRLRSGYFVSLTYPEE